MNRQTNMNPQTKGRALSHFSTDSQQSAAASTSGAVGSRPTTPTQPSTSQQQSRSSTRRYCLTEDFLGEDTSHPRSSAQLQLRNAVFGKFFDYLGSVTLVRSSTGQQVLTLTQFYSVVFSKSRIDVKSAFSTNAQSRFASVVIDGVLGPPCQHN